MRKLAFAIPIICLFLVLKLAVIKTDEGTGLLILLRGQSGQIQFVNSVTQSPVTINFSIRTGFDNFIVVTDEKTEHYYTNGSYAINSVVSKESTDILAFCSCKGISVSLGFYDFYVKDNCLEVKLLWTIF